MIIRGAVAVVTGGASGIGRALCQALAEAGAKSVIVADLDIGGARETASAIDGHAVHCNVAIEDEIATLVADVEANHGPIDLFCSNAGTGAGFDYSFANAASASNDDWQKAWAINVMAHVYAARHLVPRMKERGGGYFLQTVSAAGLLSQIGSATYSTTKHAAIGFAENLAITHHADGIRVSILCPQAVDTAMLRSLPTGPQSNDGVLSAQAVAQAALAGVENEQFLILPHQQVTNYMAAKSSDYDRWIGAMARLQKRFAAA